MAQTNKSKAKKATKSDTTARKKSQSGAETQATERDAKVIAADAAYALAGLANDALQLANEAVQLARTLPDKAQERAQELRDVKVRREKLETRVREIRERAEQRFDEKATEGRTVAEDLLGDERIRKVLDQAKNARSQVKAAITSIRKTADEAINAGAAAGKEQAEVAKTQAKAAKTSVRKAAEEAVEAAKDVADAS
jgi:hypothetical protein